ncbi:MAG: O-acetyltransferase OatA [Legionella sp.]|uniref:acyltransferase family protein n=1 Tax=Legionella sp. TaxID=459 RepID=UPI003D0BE745
MLHIVVQVFFFLIFFVIALLSMLIWKPFFNIQATSHHNEQYLEGLRGIAALAVVGCHVNQILLSYLHIPGLPATGNRIGGLGVQVFFALTAYLFIGKALQGTLDFQSFYQKRIRRIVPLYLFLSLCTIALSFRFMETPILSYVDIFTRCINVLSFGFIGNNTDLYPPTYELLVFQKYNALELIGVAWSLSYEWRFYLILPLIYYLSLNSTKRKLTLLGLVIILALRDFYTYPAVKVVWPFFIGGALAALILHYYPKLAELRFSRLFSYLIIPLLLFSVFTNDVFNFKHFILTSLLFLCIVFAKPKLLTLKPLVALGQISYSVYLMQYLVLRLVDKTLGPHVYQAPFFIKFVVCFLVIALLIPFASFTYKFIELPAMQSRFLQQFSLAWESLIYRLQLLKNGRLRDLGKLE